MFDKFENSYNKYIPISKPFKKYRIYLYRLSNKEFFINKHLKIIYVFKGNLNVHILNKTIYLSKGEVFYIGSNVPYILSSQDCINSSLVLDIKDEYLLNLTGNNYNNLIIKNIKDSKNNIVQNMISIYLSMLYGQWNYKSTLDLLNSVIYELERTETEQYQILSDGSVKCVIHKIAKWIINNLEYINFNNILLKDISTEFNINYHYLSRKFKEVINLNYTEFIAYMRMEKAVNMLINTDKNISTISFECSFKNIKIFYSCFKSLFKITPLKFRNKYKNFEKLIIKDKIHNEEETLNLFNKLRNQNINYCIEEPKVNYSLDISKFKKIDFNTSMDFIDFSSIINISSNLYYFSEIAKDFRDSNILINILISEDTYYLVDKDQSITEIDIYKLKYIMEVFKNNNSRILLILNYNFNYSNQIYIENTFKLIKLLKSTFYNLKEYIIGIKVWDLKENISYSSDLTIKSINNIINLVDNHFNNISIRWLLSIDEETENRNLEYIKCILKNLSKNPDGYILNYSIINPFLKINKKIDSFLDSAKKLKNTFKVPNEQIIIKLNYKIDNLGYKTKFYLEYLMSLSIYLFTKLKFNGFSFGYFSYSTTNINNEDRYKSYTHDQLGLIRPYFLVYNLLKSLDGSIVSISKNLTLIKSKNTFYFLIYPSYLNFLEYILKIKLIDTNKFINYTINLENLAGNFKILNYSFSIYKENCTLKEEELINITNHDRKVLSLSKLSKCTLNFKKANHFLNLQVQKNILDVLLIKVQSI